VEHLEQPDQDFAAVALGIARQFLAHAGARIFEFLRGLAVFRQILLHLRVFLGELALELLDIRRLERGSILGCGVGVLASGPPSAVDDLYRDVVFVHFSSGGFAPPNPPSPSLAGAPIPAPLRRAPSLRSGRAATSGAWPRRTPIAVARGGPN